MKSLALATLALFLAGADAALACHVPWQRFATISNGTMTVRSGEPCDITFRSLGPMPDIKVIKRPAHGSVSVGSANKVTYQSRKGYAGSDSFTYVHSGLNSLNRPVKATITIAVTVTD